MLAPLFAILRDVEGVTGSFFVSKTGMLVGRDPEANFDERIFAELGPRIERLLEALGGQSERIHWTALRYLGSKFLIRPIGSGFLCIITKPEASMPAVRMAASLVAKRLASSASPGQSGAPSSSTIRSHTGLEGDAPASSRRSAK